MVIDNKVEIGYMQMGAIDTELIQDMLYEKAKTKVWRPFPLYFAVI